jgi:23S rRNA (guanosine2251-2'-O)-methyltransferase
MARRGFKNSTKKFHRTEHRSVPGRHEKIYIYGKHALMEALTNAPHSVKKVFLSPEASANAELKALLNKHGISVASLKHEESSQLVGKDAAHQGVIAIVDTAKLIVHFNEWKETIDAGENTCLVLLDELTDPHNVGAIIRSAAAFGASGILLPAHHQAGITGAVVKASAGMVFTIPIVAIGNTNQTVDTLQRAGFRAYALAMDGTQSVDEETFQEPTLIIVGNEGKGVHQKTFERCDVTLRIPMDPRCESLNASVSAAIVLHAWSARHPKAIT